MSVLLACAGFESPMRSAPRDWKLGICVLLGFLAAWLVVPAFEIAIFGPVEHGLFGAVVRSVLGLTAGLAAYLFFFKWPN